MNSWRSISVALDATEKQEQIALIDRSRYHPICKKYLWGSMNGGKRNKREAKSLVRQGAKKGVPDLILAYPYRGFHGLFIELKRTGKRKGKLSKEQKEMLKNLGEVGYHAVVAFGAKEAWEIIINYLGEDINRNVF